MGKIIIQKETTKDPVSLVYAGEQTSRKRIVIIREDLTVFLPDMEEPGSIHRFI